MAGPNLKSSVDQLVIYHYQLLILVGYILFSRLVVNFLAVGYVKKIYKLISTVLNGKSATIFDFVNFRDLILSN